MNEDTFRVGFIEGYDEGVKNGIKQGKADAIDEIISEIANWNSKSTKRIPYAFSRYLEQLKENDNE